MSQIRLPLWPPTGVRSLRSLRFSIDIRLPIIAGEARDFDAVGSGPRDRAVAQSSARRQRSSWPNSQWPVRFHGFLRFCAGPVVRPGGKTWNMDLDFGLRIDDGRRCSERC